MRQPQRQQAKEASTSVLEAYTSPTPFGSHGERVVQGQRLMQAYGDVLLGWHYFPNSARPDYYVRQLRDWKGSLEISTLDPKALAMYAGYCAWTLARAHVAIGSPLRPISAAKIYSIKQLPVFPPPTPTRTNATLLALKKQQLTARSRWNADFKGRLPLSHDNRLSLHGIGVAV